MAFILGTLVSAPSVYAPQGEPFMFLQEEVDAINEILMNLLNENMVLHYAQSTPVTLIPEEFVILAQWEIVNATSDAGEYDRTLVDLTVYANIANNTNIGWYKSVDGGPLRADWDFHDGIIAVHTDFEIEQRFDPDSQLLAKYDFIAFAIENPIGETISVVKDFSGTVTIHLPGSESLTRLN